MGYKTDGSDRNRRVNLDYQLYLQRENSFFHQPYENELNFYTAVSQGNLEFIEELRRKYPNVEEEGKGTLSRNPVNNERYHFIINTAIITRNCIEAGLPQEEAYTLSDLYIRMADETDSVKELRALNDKMVWEFASRMRKMYTREVVSRHILRCINYIYDNLNKKLTVNALSTYVGLHPSYLSTLFKKETGYSIHTFIQNKRLETAENMLKNTRYTYADIADALCFSSQSHFIKLCREKHGITPKEYRKRYGL